MYDLFYKERIGDPTQSENYTEEYRILSDVSYDQAIEYRNRFNWIRSVWRMSLHVE